MMEMKNGIEQAIAKRNAPAPAGMQGNDAAFTQLCNELYAMIKEDGTPEGFDLKTACADPAFAALAEEFGVVAAVRIWSAEKRADEAEKNAMARLDERVQQRRGLPRSASGGGYAAAAPDYAGMDSAAFKKLAEEFRRRSRNGENVRL